MRGNQFTCAHCGKMLPPYCDRVTVTLVRKGNHYTKRFCYDDCGTGGFAQPILIIKKVRKLFRW